MYPNTMKTKILPTDTQKMVDSQIAALKLTGFKESSIRFMINYVYLEGKIEARSEFLSLKK